jgi:hypothetical protein
MLREHILQESDPGLADAGLTVGKADEVGPGRRRQSAEQRFGVWQRNTSNEVHDRVRAAIRVHELLPVYRF